MVFFQLTNNYEAAAAILTGVSIVLITTEKITITPLTFALPVAIIVGMVRWLPGTHTVGQILLGYLAGIFTQLGA